MNPSQPPAPIRQAIIPVSRRCAGVLTGGAGGSQAQLAVLDKPLIRYAVEEALAAGITELIFMIEPPQRRLSDPFDPSDDLQHELQKHQKFDLIQLVLDLQASQLTSVCVREAPEPGLAAAVFHARRTVRDEAFAVIVAEDLLHHRPNVLQQLLQRRAALHAPTQTTLVAVKCLSESEAFNDPIAPAIATGHPVGTRLMRISHIAPAASSQPTPEAMGIVGRYLLTPAIFDALEATRADPQHGLARALASLLQTQMVHAYEYEGLHYDCHSKLGHLQANVEFALRDPELHTRVGRYIASVIGALGSAAPVAGRTCSLEPTLPIKEYGQGADGPLDT